MRSSDLERVLKELCFMKLSQTGRVGEGMGGLGEKSRAVAVAAAAAAARRGKPE